jgi:hypothetical protein
VGVRVPSSAPANSSTNASKDGSPTAVIAESALCLEGDFPRIGGPLRGGSYYSTAGIDLVFPAHLSQRQLGKLPMMAPSYDRSGVPGFRWIRAAAN